MYTIFEKKYCTSFIVTSKYYIKNIKILQKQPKITVIYIFTMIIVSWSSENGRITKNIRPCDKKKIFHCFHIDLNTISISENNFRRGSNFKN